MIPRPVMISPAAPADVVNRFLHHCTYPSTLIVGATRNDFLSIVAQHIIDEKDHALLKKQREQQRRQQEEEELNDPFLPPPSAQPRSSPPPPPPPPPVDPTRSPSPGPDAAANLTVASLLARGAGRHIRIMFAHTPSHLRALLAVFSLADSRVPAPPAAVAAAHSSAPPPTPTLLIYGLLASHRGTSEWNVQGLSTTAALIDEAAMREGMRAVVVEPAAYGEGGEMDSLLEEQVPVMCEIDRRELALLDGGRWARMTAKLEKALDYWFDFREVPWVENV
ncbi:hypothetical protein QBC39DRAFT_386894 [Podospora conica]|nr:hypothetical protein QBC39DRAFT_386894 [Schizothecium conicum]